MCLWSISWLCVFPAVARPALLLCGSQHGQVVEAPWCTLLSVSLQTRGLVPLLGEMAFREAETGMRPCRAASSCGFLVQEETVPETYHVVVVVVCFFQSSEVFYFSFTCYALSS